MPLVVPVETVSVATGTSYAEMVADIRRILNDRPSRAQLTASITTDTITTFTVSAADILQFAVGNLWEHDDGTNGAEQRRVTAIDTSTNTITAERGFNNSTATEHTTLTYLLKEPRFLYDTVVQAIDQTISNDLYPRGVYDLATHVVTSQTSAQGSDYNAPSTDCQEFVDVYQRISAIRGIEWRGIMFDQQPRVADTTLFSNGKAFHIEGNYGVAGTDSYYVLCKHKADITTLTEAQQTLTQMRACQYLLEWTEPRRIQGPTNQGDRSVPTPAPLQGAAFFAAEFERLARNEAMYLKDQAPKRRRKFVRNV